LDFGHANFLSVMCDRTGYGLSRLREPHGIPVGTGDPLPPNENGDPDRHRGLDPFH
jgi:hypothetical protein